MIPIRLTFAVGDLGEGPGGPGPPSLFWVKKEEITEGRIAGRASKTTPPPPPPKKNHATSCLVTAVLLICFVRFLYT